MRAPDSFGGSRSPLQVGAELYGHAGVDSDAEILSLMLNTFNVAGVDDVYLDLGNVDIFKGLSKQAGLNVSNESLLFEMLQSKEIPKIEQLLGELKIDDNIRQMLMQLAELNGDENVIQRARECLAKADAQVHKAIDYLEKTAELVKARFNNIALNFDLAELHGYHYQTGVVFAAFVPQLGEAIARGGRYDDIGQIFGRARAATGFSTDLKLLDSLSKRKHKPANRVFAPISDDAGLRKKIDELRAQKMCIVEQLPDQSDDAAAMGCDQILKLVDGQWQVIGLTDV